LGIFACYGIVLSKRANVPPLLRNPVVDVVVVFNEQVVSWNLAWLNACCPIEL